MALSSERGINYDEKLGVLSTREFIAQMEFADSWELVPDAPGVTFLTFTLNGVRKEARDGALVKIAPGMRTPVQQVQLNQTFWEIAVIGNPTLLTVSPEGKFTVGSDRAKLTKGWSMCWVAAPDCEALVLEYEKPAFKDTSLVTVPKDSGIYNYQFPQEFWNAIELFDKKKS